jgi:hypothetical protein
MAFLRIEAALESFWNFAGDDRVPSLVGCVLFVGVLLLGLVAARVGS